MFAITGITGKVGGHVARHLLNAGRPLRAVVCDGRKSTVWAELGCEVAQADMNDAGALASAFEGLQAVFVLVPPNFDPAPGFPEARTTAVALKAALERARPDRVVYLSTIGADATESNLLTQHTIIEETLRELPLPVTFLRAAWFIDNSAVDIAPAKRDGIIPNFLQPLNKPVPMVATADVGRTAAELLQETWTGQRVVELEGSRRVTPNDIAATFAKLLGRPVMMQTVPRENWESLFKSQGMNNPIPRIRMLDGFNEGWIEFRNGEAGSRKGSVSLEAALQTLLAREGH
jgi:uncharacterized protein YbjT (DUF2867 family)